jgi:hypothetical protein
VTGAELTRPAAPGWTAVATAAEGPWGERWDVRLEHVSGVRVPPGANWQADAEPELARLVAVVG